ncbi:glutathione synthase/RimK-type ligase-like ATP-grasp enzyme [Caldalkalibacillus uzonensis]|uniref:Glutathione synthase/RimK-type ligase-like ATP-grasp enzyme n=1 Tax=Caldalkalibacillus uzonensis TaxID=353224 RepID=A0ABU0CQ93_9BACI|nr:YheC/YheD family protein [Caldalkalibacillus uzonensis]MDQ0338071.1 glutathione synthase/RimK-type ligase-like ATP-grasp enzyme [Caldalkalibacillus uzonensis]
MVKQPHLGILVEFVLPSDPPFPEKVFFKHLSQHAKTLGIQVTVFSPRSIDWTNRLIWGYRYDENKARWKKGTYPFPTMIYDRIFYQSRQHVRDVAPVIKRLQQNYSVLLLGKGLPGKWKVYNMLKDDENLAPFLPETFLFRPGSLWRKKLVQHEALFFKPSSGTHGKGVLKVIIAEGRIHVQGRTWHNHLLQTSFPSFTPCEMWLKKYVGQRQYIVQPYLQLTTPDETPFDMRILLQKNDKGEWTETGKVIRAGQKGKLTSNLHGGGTAVEVSPFLNKYYRPEQVKDIYAQLKLLTKRLPYQLEMKHGPLLELGIDVGIERTGKVWLLEVNSKPGRRSFRLSRDYEALANAIYAPAKYASYVFHALKGV